MGKGDKGLKPLNELRRQAEQKAKQNIEALRNQSRSKMEELVYELQVHQIELEMQNEELRRAHLEIEALQHKYFDLFDLAPVGYFAFDENGLIVEANLTGAELLGTTKIHLLKKAFSHWITPESQDTFYLNRRETIRTGVPHTYELKLLKSDSSEFFGQLVSRAELDEEGHFKQLRATVLDITERKKAEEAYHSLVDHSLQGLAIFQDGRVVFANQAMAQITGHSVEEILAAPPEKVQAFVYPDDRELVWNRHRDRLNGEELPERYELRGIRKDGSICWLELDANRIEYEGKPAIQAAYIDITKRKEAEKALRASEEMFRSIFETSLVGVAICSTDKKWLYMNDQICKILGYSDQELRQTTWEKLTHPDDLEADISQYNRLLAGEIENYYLEKRFIRKDGSVVYARIYISAKKNQYGAVEYNIGLLEDITERKQAEENLRESEERYRSLFEGAEDHIFVLDRDFRYVMVNPSALKAGSFTLEDVVGKGPREVFPEDAEFYLSQYRQTFETGKPVDFERELRLPNATHWFSVTLSPIEDTEGRVIALTGISRDITERKKAEQERLANVHFLESMDRVNRAIQGTNDLEQMMSDVLDEVLSIFDCDRAWLVYPCDPAAASWCTQMERTKPNYPGALALGLEAPMDPDVANVCRLLLESDEPVKFDAESLHPLPREMSRLFGYQSQILMAIYPKKGAPWAFGLHQCSYPRVWTPQEERLLQEIGRRLEDRLTSLIIFRDLRESEEKFKKIFDQSPIAIEIYNSNGLLIDANAECLELFGVMCLDDVKGFKLFDDPNLPEDAKEMLLQNNPVHYETEFSFDLIKEKGLYKTSKSGKASLNIHIASLYDSDNEISGYLVQVEDITEHKKIEKALREKEEMFRSIFETTIVGVAICSTDKKWLYMNDQICKILGYSEQELRQTTWEKLTHPDDLEADVTQYNRLLAGEIENYYLEKRFIRKDGSVVYARIYISAKKNQYGAVEYNIGLLEDITEHKQAEEQLLAYQAKLKAMASQLSSIQESQRRQLAVELHDRVTQRLAMVKLGLQTLVGTIADAEIATKIKEVAEQVGCTMEDAYSLMLELSNPVLYEIGLTPAVDALLQSDLVKSPGIKCRLVTPGQSMMIDTDTRVVLYQTIRELLVNAIKHSKATEIEVHLGRTDSTASVTVKDDGIGFDPSDIKLPGKEGGFGLFNIRENIGGMGGTFTIESKPGVGTSVTACVPLPRKDSPARKGGPYETTDRR